jgi:DNA replication and repair protein RecF
VDGKRGQKFHFKPATARPPGRFIRAPDRGGFCSGRLEPNKGRPQQRRQALNFLLLQTNRSYYFYLREFNRVLAQRNTYLKRLTPSPGNEMSAAGLGMSNWPKFGVELMVRRQQALMAMAPWIRRI